MKEIAKNSPNGWDLYKKEWKYNELNPQFGYLVLEFFPSHGIHIESRYDWKLNKTVWFVFEKSFLDAYTFSTPKKAIAKAFKIFEKQLEEKI